MDKSRFINCLLFHFLPCMGILKNESYSFQSPLSILNFGVIQHSLILHKILLFRCESCGCRIHIHHHLNNTFLCNTLHHISNTISFHHFSFEYTYSFCISTTLIYAYLLLYILLDFAVHFWQSYQTGIFCDVYLLVFCCNYLFVSFQQFLFVYNLLQ